MLKDKNTYKLLPTTTAFDFLPSDQGIYITPSGYTMSQWLREWLITYALPTVKQSTYISYESYVRLHLESALGTSKLTSLTVEQLQHFFNQKKQSLSPKSVTAQRTIPLFPQVWNDLMTYYKKQQELLRAQGISLTPTTPIFSTPLGIIYEPRTYEDLFKRTLSEAGVSDINFHALRHTFAPRALEAGMDIKVLSSI